MDNKTKYIAGTVIVWLGMIVATLIQIGDHEHFMGVISTLMVGFVWAGIIAPGSFFNGEDA